MCLYSVTNGKKNGLSGLNLLINKCGKIVLGEDLVSNVK